LGQEEIVTTTRRKLVKSGSFAKLMADGYQIEGTKLFVLELLMFGFAYSSLYLLLRSPSLVGRLEEEEISVQVGSDPTKFGRKLAFDRDLELDAVSGEIYYVGPVAHSDLLA